MTAMKLHRYPSPSGGVALGKIGARRTARILPYDAEVEYLESTGTQWIDTGIAHTGACKWECDAAITQTNLVNRFIGQTYRTAVSSPRLAFGMTSGGLWYCGIGNLNSNGSMRADNNRHSFVADAPNKGFYIDGSKVFTMSWTSFALPSVVYGGLALFGRKYLDNGVISPFVAMRIYSSKHYDSDILVRDFQPVRFTNDLGQSEGAMYDRANPTVGMNPDGSARTDGLYRNRGTGAFLYGNDI